MDFLTTLRGRPGAATLLLWFALGLSVAAQAVVIGPGTGGGPVPATTPTTATNPSIPGLAPSALPEGTGAISGVVVDAASGQPIIGAVVALSVAIQPLRGTASATVGGTNYGGMERPASGRVNGDGTFVLTGLTPGQYRLTVSAPNSPALTGLWTRSAVVDGRDVLDSLVTVAPGVNVEDAIVTLTDRHTELSGALQSPAGRPASDYFVVVVPAEREWWMADARRVRSTRPATDGQFVFTDLPAGSYLVAAVDDLEPSDLADSQFLEALAKAAIPVTLADGETKRQDIRLRK